MKVCRNYNDRKVQHLKHYGNIDYSSDIYENDEIIRMIMIMMSMKMMTVMMRGIILLKQKWQ